MSVCVCVCERERESVCVRVRVRVCECVSTRRAGGCCACAGPLASCKDPLGVPAL